MKFIDTATILIRSGHGGAGAVSFRREKYIPKGGPDGGDGGAGGHVILQATPKLQTLMDFKANRLFKAKNGEPGRKKNKSGSKGEDCIIRLPCGTMVFDETGDLVCDLTQELSQFIIACGGKGGKGNAQFATATHQVPRYAQPGLPGEEKQITLELRLIAQVGLIGLPNAGKSTLLKTLTNANPKIAAYPFTTLFPNLGVLKAYDTEIVLADIPGLIKGASEGHGLGKAFLRHVDRTQLLVHLVSVDQGDKKICYENYLTILDEILKSEFDFSQKKSIVCLSQIDTISPEQISEFQAYFKKKDVQTLAISAYSGAGIDDLKITVKKEAS